MLIDGQAQINEHFIQRRDAVGVWNFLESVKIKFTKNSRLLAIEVPMN